MLAAVVAAGVWAFGRSHDSRPRDITACATAQGAHLAAGADNLSFARDDIRAGRLRVAQRYSIGPDRGVLLAGSGYRVLVVDTPKQPSLTGVDLPMRVYDRTPKFAAVLTERDPLHVLDGCARAAG
jgi:hypothetical protein